VTAILDLCGGTGGWSEPYREAGYDVYIIDPIVLEGDDARLFPSKHSDKPRLPNDFRGIDHLIENIGNIHGILAAPVCTVFSASGARWPRTDEEILEGLSLVDACIRIAWAFKPKWWALENPVGKLRKWLGDPLMTYQPYEYGDPYTKRTLLWGDFNTELPRDDVEPTEGSKLWRKYGGRSERTKRLRSATPSGFARAFFEANP